MAAAPSSGLQPSGITFPVQQITPIAQTQPSNVVSAFTNRSISFVPVVTTKSALPDSSKVDIPSEKFEVIEDKKDPWFMLIIIALAIYIVFDVLGDRK